MNSEKIIELLLNGAYQEDSKLFHSSFRKGYRKISSSNISFRSAMRKLSNTETPVKYENKRYSL
jgi:hypothetical protein